MPQAPVAAPAAAPAAVPARTRRNPLPFAAVPHALAEDVRLKPIDLAVTRALLKHARGDDHAWPSVGSLAAQVGRTRRTVQFALRRLEASGWIVAEPATNPTGRVLVLTWRREGSATAGASPARSMAPPPAQPEAPNRDVPVRRPIHGEATRTQGFSRSRRQTQPALGHPVNIPAPDSIPPAPTPKADPVSSATQPTPTPAPPSEATGPRPATARRRWSTEAGELTEVAHRTADPILARELSRRTAVAPAAPARPGPATTGELLTRLREKPQYPAEAAELLAREFADRKSWPGFLARCREAWDGRRTPEELAEAYRLATAPGARNPGAVFMAALRAGRANTHHAV